MKYARVSGLGIKGAKVEVAKMSGKASGEVFSITGYRSQGARR
jgi:hypothetical protein